VIKTTDTQNQTEQLKPAQNKKSSQTRISALAIFALGLNAAAAVYTSSPSDFALPNVSGLVAELLPHDGASAPIPGTVVAALNHIQVAQQDSGSLLHQNTALLERDGSVLERNTELLQQNGSVLEGHTALLMQDSSKLDILRSSLTDEQSDVKTIQSDVKTIAAQLTTLIAKVDSLPKTMSSEITSSIPKDRARSRVSSVARKRVARRIKPDDPFSLDGAPFSIAPVSHSPAG
jgi:hypothetical protein